MGITGEIVGGKAVGKIFLEVQSSLAPRTVRTSYCWTFAVVSPFLSRPVPFFSISREGRYTVIMTCTPFF